MPAPGLYGFLTGSIAPAYTEFRPLYEISYKCCSRRIVGLPREDSAMMTPWNETSWRGAYRRSAA